MKVSIITVCYNAEKYIADCAASVLSQDYPDIEYIVIDGASKDNTLEKLEPFKEQIAKLVSEPDKGIYDAMNKGVQHATGDIVGILNADDLYQNDHVISDVLAVFQEKKVDSVYGDLIFVQPDNLEKVVRFYSPKSFKPDHFKRGDMPPHPTFFVKKELYEEFGLFDTSFKITADFEIMVRMILKGGATYAYLPQTLVKMRVGGVSTSGIKSKVELNKEIKRALEMNGIKSSTAKIYSKYFTKVFQLVKRPEK